MTKDHVVRGTEARISASENPSTGGLCWKSTLCNPDVSNDLPFLNLGF